MNTATSEMAVPPSRGARRFPTWAKVGIGLVLLVLGLLVLIPNCETSRTRLDLCTACFAHRTSAEKGLWVHGKHALRGSTEVEEGKGNPEVEEFLDGSHAHRWRFLSTGHAFLGLNHGSACATPAFNPVASALRNHEGFRDSVRRRVAGGALGGGDLVAILELPPNPGPAELADPGVRALLEKGRALLREGGLVETGVWGSGVPGSPPR